MCICDKQSQKASRAEESDWADVQSESSASPLLSCTYNVKVLSDFFC